MTSLTSLFILQPEDHRPMLYIDLMMLSIFPRKPNFIMNAFNLF